MTESVKALNRMYEEVNSIFGFTKPQEGGKDMTRIGDPLPASYDDWKTGGASPGIIESEVIGECVCCHENITEDDIHWIFPDRYGSNDYVCDDCLENYCKQELGAILVD